MLYFELLPIEINNIILFNLDYDELYEIEQFLPINYEELFSIKYPKQYLNIKKVFNTDKTIRFKPDNLIWGILYKDIKHTGYKNMISQNFVINNPISFNIYYTAKIIDSNFFWMKEKLFNGGFRSDYLSYYVYLTIEILKLIHIDTKEKLYSMKTEFIRYEKSIETIIISLLLIELPGYKININKLINNTLDYIKRTSTTHSFVYKLYLDLYEYSKKYIQNLSI